MRMTHDPQAVLDYNWDWTLWLQPGETIVDFSLSIVPDDGNLYISTSSFDGPYVVALIGGGLLGRTYEVICHVVSSFDREDDRTIYLLVQDEPAASTSACTWPVDYAECGPCDALASLPASGIQKFEEMATEYLWHYTEQQFGLCQGTVRPCRQECTEGVSTYGPAPGGSPWQPTLVGGRWLNLGCGGGCRDKCGCGAYGQSLVFDQPVVEVIEIEIDGEILDPVKYRVDNYRFLVRQDGGQWPYCQDMSKQLGEPDTWAVTVRIGAAVPMGGRMAAGKLACELAKAACGATGCELPQRWQTITRQGVTISAALDSFEGLDEGKTGIWLIDSWVASVTKARNASMGVSIASPDYSGFGRRTTFGG